MKDNLQDIILHIKKTESGIFNLQTSNNKYIELPNTNNSYLYLILDGAIQFPDLKEYKALEFFISAIDSPRSVKILEKPFLALSLEFTNDEIIEVMLDIEGDFVQKDNNGKILDCLMRLLSLKEDDNKFLQKHIKREIIFNLITDKNGGKLIENIVRFQNAEEIYKINTWIKNNFKCDFSVEDLAQKMNMSVSGFHQKFKSAVGMGPIHCQKKLRLIEARCLMLNENKNVTEAALEVGYESVSQFVRDYKKILGLPPKEDILKIKNCAKNLKDMASD